MIKEKIIIGIDPDVTKSGVAIKKGKNVELLNLEFFSLFRTLSDLYSSSLYEIKVYIECGFLNKSNWHTKTGKSAAFNAKIGEHTGANFETAKKIVEMCQYLGLPYQEVKPTRSKVDASFFKQITKIEKRTNQEQRDAYMLIHGIK